MVHFIYTTGLYTLVKKTKKDQSQFFGKAFA